MSIFTRFFGQHREEGGGTQLIANPQIETPLSLQLLFDRRLRLQSSDVTAALQAFHGSMANARCEIDPTLGEEGKIFGLAGWANHVVKLVGFDLPMPAEAVESCVAPSHYPKELKDRARSHSGHVLLFYAGYESSPHEQYVALASAAGALSQFGAIVILNEAGRTSLPAAALSGSNVDCDIIELLRTLPLAIFYCGFIKYEVDGTPGVWMRTYGAHLLGLPDFAAHASGHDEGQRYFDIFENIFSYLRDSGSALAAGHTIQVEEHEYLRCRERSEDEYFLDSDGELLVAEIIGPDEINQ
jgi:hypothetical protein